MRRLLAVLTLLAAGAWTSAPADAQTSATIVSSTALESNHVIKNVPGSLSWLTIDTTTTSGYLMIFNATSAPADGAVTPAYCVPVAASSGTPLNWINSPMYLGTGIVAVFSTTGCYTKTASSTAAFFAGVF